jgi:hypothetical protein
MKSLRELDSVHTLHSNKVQELHAILEMVPDKIMTSKITEPEPIDATLLKN